MKAFLKYLTLFLVGGAFYYALEVLFRGYSFLAMAGCGGLCFIICGVINEKSRCMPLVLQQLIAASGITVIEFIFGLILNVWLGLNMWDYSNMPGNILGQICPQFMVLWFFLSAIGIILDDVIRWRLFGEEKPHYHLFKKGHHRK
ncbi:putative ABC transporter permease [Mediterraneibacter faecis]|uniref:putative ABC transporter permease n=1 Tax=Mediterraneibacter faecis TaxID=592978 RepID=UPI001C02045F